MTCTCSICTGYTGRGTVASGPADDAGTFPTTSCLPYGAYFVTPRFDSFASPCQQRLEAAGQTITRLQNQMESQAWAIDFVSRENDREEKRRKEAEARIADLERALGYLAANSHRMAAVEVGAYVRETLGRPLQ